MSSNESMDGSGEENNTFTCLNYRMSELGKKNPKDHVVQLSHFTDEKIESR